MDRYEPEPPAALMAAPNAPNDPMVPAPIDRITVTQTTMIKDSITAYSTAAGPSSVTKNWRRPWGMAFIGAPAADVFGPKRLELRSRPTTYEKRRSLVSAAFLVTHRRFPVTTMRKRRNADEVARLLREADRDLAKGLTVGAVCRELEIAQTTYHRWRQRHDPARVDTDHRCRELEVEVERLKRLVAERLLDEQMLQDIAKESGDPRPAAGGGGLPGRALRHFATAGRPRPGAVPVEPAISPEAAGRRAGDDAGDPTAVAAVPSVWIPTDSSRWRMRGRTRRGTAGSTTRCGRTARRATHAEGAQRGLRQEVRCKEKTRYTVFLMCARVWKLP